MDDMLSESAPAPETAAVSHNEMGQRLGRKGKETRNRILCAFEKLLAGPPDCPITLSSVAREAAIGMTTLYLYFPDLGALVLAGLKRLTDQGRVMLVETINTRWPDDDLERCCREFTSQYYEFWRQHGRILRMRNSLADASDERFIEARSYATMPLVNFMAAQMDGDPDGADDPAPSCALAVMMGLERISTVVTSPGFPFTTRDCTFGDALRPDLLIAAEARLIELAVRDRREAKRRA